MLAAVVVSATAPAGAQQDAEAKDAARARRIFKKGAKLYRAGEYERAIVFFRSSHNLVPHPLLLYNIALSYQKLDRCDRAVASARRALEFSEPRLDVATRAKARGLVAGCGLAMRAPLRARRMRRGRSPAGKAPTDAAEARQPRSWSGTWKWIGVGTLVVGGGLLVGSTLALINLNQRIDDLDREDPDEERGSRRIDVLLRRQRVVRGLFFSGVGLTTVGALLLIVELVTGDDRESESDTVTMLPVVGRRSFGLGLTFRF
jgi:tetratricopeptide (TPR) repeat protein